MRMHRARFSSDKQHRGRVSTNFIKLNGRSTSAGGENRAAKWRYRLSLRGGLISDCVLIYPSLSCKINFAVYLMFLLPFLRL